MNIEVISKIAAVLGFKLEEEQPHISGERFLMSKEKLVLVAKEMSDNKKVIIKVSNLIDGKRDINNEKRARDLLKSVNFARKAIIFPDEIFFGEKSGYLLWIMEFIEQDNIFVEYNIQDQFFLALNAFEAQESFHATTYEHLEAINKVFPILHAQEYFKEFKGFKTNITNKSTGSDPEGLFAKAEIFLQQNKKTIDKYCNYLTHTDFVPHNFRIKNRQIYMLDCSPEYRTTHFGNKYESWARFLNYMVIHNPQLEKILAKYIRENRGEEDYLALRLMRLYKVAFLLDFYANSLPKTHGNLYELTKERIDFWFEILKFILEDKDMPVNFIENYKKKRDSLRTEEEKKRQREFAIA